MAKNMLHLTVFYLKDVSLHKLNQDRHKHLCKL